MGKAEHVLGIEGGGTKTSWMLVRRAEDRYETLDSGRLPGTNLRLTSPERLRMILSELPRDAARIGVFLAGCATLEDAKNLRGIARSVWPTAELIVGSDRDSGMAAALQDRDGIVVNAGTGASVTGRCGDRIENAGGWGHVLGDTGGGYFLSIRALRTILQEYDLRRGEVEFAAQILRALGLNTLDDLVRWAQAAEKMEIAMLAREVFVAARKGDVNALDIINEGARALAAYTAAVASRLALAQPAIRLIGGLFNETIYIEALRRELHAEVGDDIQLAEHPPEFGAVWLALRDRSMPAIAPAAEVPSDDVASTEQPNVRSAELDRLSPRAFVSLFATEERSVENAIVACSDALAQAIEMVAHSMREGGSLFYVGAGTSGRLGVLDASEIPPTFGAPPELVQGIIAGGVAALHRSVEGAEDDRESGALVITERNVTRRDVVVGITASGRTPFVLGALQRASVAGAKTIFLTCNEVRPRAGRFDLEIDLPTGPELVTGSTRLKAGTATKVALNIISTGAMIQLGKVRGNSMIDLHATNSKLRNRAIRIVAEALECDFDSARARLEKHSWNARAAIDDAGKT